MRLFSRDGLVTGLPSALRYAAEPVPGNAPGRGLEHIRLRLNHGGRASLDTALTRLLGMRGNFRYLNFPSP